MAKMAKDLQVQNMLNRQADRVLRRVDQAEQDGRITPNQARDLRHKALSASIDGDAGSNEPFSSSEVDRIAATAQDTECPISVETPDGGRVDVGPESMDDIMQRVITDDTVNDSESRAFHPAMRGVPEVQRMTTPQSNGGTELNANVTDAEVPGNVTVLWEAEPPDAVMFMGGAVQNENVYQGGIGDTVNMLPIRPGRAKIRVSATETINLSTGTRQRRLGSSRIDISVPQYVQVQTFNLAPQWNPAGIVRNLSNLGEFNLFEDFIAAIGLNAGQRHALLAEAKATADYLLRDANVRIVWFINPLNETLPNQFGSSNSPVPGNLPPDSMYMRVILEGTYKDPRGSLSAEDRLAAEEPFDNVLGLTTPGPAPTAGSAREMQPDIGPFHYNEGIRIFPSQAILTPQSGFPHEVQERMMALLDKLNDPADPGDRGSWVRSPPWPSAASLAAPSHTRSATV